MTITVSPKIEHALTVEAARRGTTPNLLAEQILLTSLTAAEDESAAAISPDQILHDLITRAQALELPSTSPSASETPFGDAIVEKYRRQGFTL